MRKEIWRTALVVMTLLLSVPHIEPLQTRKAETPPHKRNVSLDTVLSCASDELIADVFATDRMTALNSDIGTVILWRKEHPHDLWSKRFVTFHEGGDDFEIWPTDYRGVPIPKPQLPFCRYRPLASYLGADSASSPEAGMKVLKSGPHSVDISGDDWTLNEHEVFAHADQFEFTSGVFTDSSRVFLLATKGRVAIQFICKPTELVFFRAIYHPESGK